MHTMKRLVVVILAMSWLAAGVAQAQNGNGISSPRDNAVVSGQAIIQGTATDPAFLRYELAFFKEFDPLGDWIVFATGDRPVVNGVLTTWDTTIGRDAGAPFYPDGTYRLRLRVVRQDSNYDEYYVLGLSLANAQPTPTVEVSPTAEIAASPGPTSAILVPTELPTLTPFPSATPRPTAEGGAAETTDQQPPRQTGGSPFSLEGQFSFDQIQGGVLLGIKLAVWFFAALVLYLLFRGALRLVLARWRDWEIPERVRDRFSR